MSELENEIRSACNRCSAENGSDTPDFILSRYLLSCLEAFDAATRRRDEWYGNKGLRERLNQTGEVTE